jgi:hypothetical protein
MRSSEANGHAHSGAETNPTFVEPAGHKLPALFDRAAARDLADVYVLARRFGKNVVLAGRADRRGLPPHPPRPAPYATGRLSS